MQAKIEQGRQFVAFVEKDIDHGLENHIIDLFMDNADKLGFNDDDCLVVGNAIRADKGLPAVTKWWK